MQPDPRVNSSCSEVLAAPQEAVDAPLKKTDYRPDIDGLRAIAVLSVVVFHAFPSLLHGGFVGVDIFFVISGYLISKHIREDLRAGTFSIKRFYARRVRRIFPALSVILLACLAMGWAILTPGEYEQLGKHVVAGAIFVSNLVFWKEAGYFDNAADTKPLLHLWSLGIEEQFYIVWPLILAFFWRYTRHLSWIFLGILGASLAYSMAVVSQDVVADFYSPFTRFWELALGAGLVFLIAHKPSLKGVNYSTLSWLGLILILSAVILVKQHYAFPGAWALLPTVGAACMIYAGEKAWLNRQVLSHRLVVWVGLISYPLYLWHWPLLSFARIMESETPSAIVRFSLLLTSVVLAWLTYRLIERPLRWNRESRNVVLGLCLVMFLVAAAGLAVKKKDGFRSRQFSMMNGDSSTMVLGGDMKGWPQECGLSAQQKPKFQYCMRSGPNAHYAVLGDSKGEALFYGLARESAPDMQWVMIGSVYPPESDGKVGDHQQLLKNTLAWQTVIADPSIRVVALTMALRGIFSLDSETGFIAGNASPAPEKIELYSQSIQLLEQAGKQVVFVIDNPTFPDPTSCISGGATSSPFLNQFLRRKENPYCTIRYTDHLAGTQAYREFVGELKRRHPSLTVYDPAPVLCDTEHNVCAMTHEGKFLYSYGDHISDYANTRIARDMLPIIRGLRND